MDRIVRTPEVVRLTGLSKTTIWRRVRSGDFPLPLKLGSLGTRSIGWREAMWRTGLITDRPSRSNVSSMR